MKTIKFIFAFFFFGSALPLLAITPMDYYNSLVAGGLETGYKDGLFYDAEFSSITSLALDASGDRLFVTDRSNNRIRVIYLNENDRVETLAGNGKAECKDGILLEAAFNQPTQIVSLPNDRLAVYEMGDGLVREIDLNTKQVSTIGTAGIRSAWNMAYWPKGNGLYLTAPDSGILYKLDLKTGKLSTVFTNDVKVPNPGAIYSDSEHLYVSDFKLPEIYQIEPSETTITAQSSTLFKVVGKGEGVIALTKADGVLYALQTGDTPLARVSPNYSPVSLISPWGFALENINSGYKPLLKFSDLELAGFISSPKESKKIYIAHADSVLSVKDYDFAEYTEASSYNTDLTDFSYPVQKPPKTFRILIYGDSRVVTAPVVFPSSGPNSTVPASNTFGMRVHTFPKQLEFMLNAQGALRGVDEHFEVLSMGHLSWHIPITAHDDLPALAKKYNVDLAIVVVTASDQNGFEDYYVRPISSEGAPIGGIDPDLPPKNWSTCKVIITGKAG